MSDEPTSLSEVINQQNKKEPEEPKEDANIYNFLKEHIFKQDGQIIRDFGKGTIQLTTKSNDTDEEGNIVEEPECVTGYVILRALEYSEKDISAVQEISPEDTYKITSSTQRTTSRICGKMYEVWGFTKNGSPEMLISLREEFVFGFTPKEIN